MIYVSRTYTPITPYLKCLHQTIDSWRPYRREDGWRMSSREIDLIRDGNGQCQEYETLETPITVLQAKILAGDVKALKELTNYTEPPLREVRCTKKSSVF